MVGEVSQGQEEKHKEKEGLDERRIGRDPRMVGEGRELRGMVGDMPDFGGVGSIGARDAGGICGATYEGMGRVDTTPVVGMVGEASKRREDGV